MQPETVTIKPGVLRLLRMLLLCNLAIVFGIFCIAIGLIGVGKWTVVACSVAIALITTLFLIAAIMQRPRVVITPKGFVFEKLIGREAHQWDEIDGQFAVIRIGITKAVAYKLTPECKARTGKKPNPMFAGYDAAIGGGALPGSPSELAELLNEHKRRNQADDSRRIDLRITEQKG